MRVSSLKRSPLLYLFLVLILVVFIGLYTMPLLSGMLQSNKTYSRKTTASVPSLSPERQEELASQARGYELVLEREPDNDTALKGLMEVRLEQGDLPGATEPLEKLANLHQEQTGYTILLAQAKQQIGDYDAAIKAYRKILDRQLGNMDALQGLVRLLLLQNLPERAIGELQDVLKLAPEVNAAQPGSVDVISVQLLLAQVYVEQKRYKSAIAVYDQATESDKQDWRPVLAKAMVLQQQGKDEAARPLFTTAISLAPAKYKDQIKQIALKANEVETDLEEQVQPQG